MIRLYFLIAISALSMAAASSPVVVRTDVPDNAFTADSPPRFVLTIPNEPAALVRIEHVDLISEETRVDWLESPKPGELIYTPKLPYGLHRFSFAAVSDRASPPTDAVSLLTAYAPAHRAADLPDDWPLASHHIKNYPLLPGFKWYRHFQHWSRIQPAPDRWNWEELDAVYADIKAAGGKLVIAGDGCPDWTTTRPDQNRSIHGSQYAPDNWDDLRTYLRTLLARYDDGSGTLAVLEAWNEPNADHRWADTPESLVKLHRIFYEETRSTNGRVRVAGLTISPGHHLDYVERLVGLGVLNYADIIAGHWYEEMGSLQRETPVNNLPMHVALLRNPMLRQGLALPIWNTETEAAAGPRMEDRFISQNELNATAEADPSFKPDQPWRAPRGWRTPSERRYAARCVTGFVSLLAENVTMNFTFHPRWYRAEGTLVLPWVSQMVLGSVLLEVDYHHVMPFAIEKVGGPENTAAVAHRLGRYDGKNVVIAWAYQSDLKAGRPDRWKPWQQPVPLTFRTASDEVIVEDLYRREKHTIKVVDGRVTIEAGEEPVYIWGLSQPAKP